MAKEVMIQSKYHCRDCVHSYDWHEKNSKCELFMCRCRLSKWTKFLNRNICDKFKKKE